MLDYPEYQCSVWITPICLFKVIIVLFYVFWSLRSRNVEGVGGKGSGDGAAIEPQTFFEAFLNISLRSACFPVEAFL